MRGHGNPDPDALHNATDWFVHLNSGNASEQDWQAFYQWLECSIQHQQAWQRIQSLQSKLTQIPGNLSKPTLDRNQTNQNKNKSFKLLSVLLVVGFLAAFTSLTQFSRVNHHTVKGEIKTIRLDDGTEVTLNTDTNIAVDYGLFERTIQLRTGEILIDTSRDSALIEREFSVQTPSGKITALGTRFDVRLQEGSVNVAVYEGRVAITPKLAKSDRRILDSGQSTAFDNQQVHATTSSHIDDLAWTRGMYIAEDVPLCHFIAELNRYQDNRIICPSHSLNINISGAFPLDQPTRVLQAVTASLPVTTSRQPNGNILLQPRP